MVNHIIIHDFSPWLTSPSTPKYQHAYSPHCSLYIPYGTNQEDLYNNQKLPQILMISFNLVTYKCDSAVIIEKDFRCYSLVEVKELFSLTHSNMFLVYMVFWVLLSIFNLRFMCRFALFHVSFSVHLHVDDWTTNLHYPLTLKD